MFLAISHYLSLISDLNFHVSIHKLEGYGLKLIFKRTSFYIADILHSIFNADSFECNLIDCFQVKIRPDFFGSKFQASLQFILCFGLSDR